MHIEANPQRRVITSVIEQVYKLMNRKTERSEG